MQADKGDKKSRNLTSATQMKGDKGRQEVYSNPNLVKPSPMEGDKGRGVKEPGKGHPHCGRQRETRV